MPNIEIICKNVKAGLGILRRIRDLVPTDSLKRVFISIIQSHFNYCSSVWDNCNKGLKDKLQKLQNQTVRIITRSAFQTRSAYLLK